MRMNLQRQPFLLSYFSLLSGGPARVDFSRGTLLLNQLRRQIQEHTY